MKYPIELVAALPILPTEKIHSQSALAVDADGHAHHLRGGERFVGFTVEPRDPSRDERRLSITFQPEGIIELKVDGAKISDLGRVVFATSENSFTISKSDAASPIGHLVAPGYYNKFWVKFSAAKIA